MTMMNNVKNFWLVNLPEGTQYDFIERYRQYFPGSYRWELSQVVDRVNILCTESSISQFTVQSMREKAKLLKAEMGYKDGKWSRRKGWKKDCKKLGGEL